MSTMFLIVRRALQDEGCVCQDQEGNDTGSRVPLRLFPERGEAEAFAAQLSIKARRSLDPFSLLDIEVTAAVGQQLEQLRLLPCPGVPPWNQEWEEWWNRCQDVMSDEQRTAVWSVFQDAPLFEVVRVEVNDE